MMRKINFILLFFPLSIFSQNTLIFSEYGEGSSFNKWIEIYNPTSQNINLDEYRYNFCWNGCDSLKWEFSITFDSAYILMPGETYLITHYNADSVLINSSNQTTNLLSNGNDVLALYHNMSNTIIDIIGVFDSTDVGEGWDVDGITNATKNHTMIRNIDVCNGNNGDWNLSNGLLNNSEWTVGDIDNYNDLNTHNSNCINNTAIQDVISKKKKIIKIIDLLGRDSHKEKNHILFYIYDDNSIEKIISFN